MANRRQAARRGFARRSLALLALAALGAAAAIGAGNDAPAAAAAKPGSAPAWTVGEGSTISFRTSWSGSAIGGGFKAWKADIRFSPDALDRSSVRVAVDTGSGFGNYNEVTSGLPGELWFDAPKCPEAVFVADAFERLGPERYRAAGTLTMKGVSRPLEFPFTLKIEGKTATMSAEIPLDRTLFGIGTGQYADTATIPAEVVVGVKLNATRAK